MAEPSALPPVTSFPHPDIFAALGAEGLRDLLRGVYRRLAASSIAELFPREAGALEAAADRSALFFVGICGGPPLYEQRFGPPRMRLRHAPFRITEQARVVWLSCWEAELVEAPARLGFPAEHLGTFREYLVTFSKWMVNA